MMLFSTITEIKLVMLFIYLLTLFLIGPLTPFESCQEIIDYCIKLPMSET